MTVIKFVDLNGSNYLFIYFIYLRIDYFTKEIRGTYSLYLEHTRFADDTIGDSLVL